MGRLFGFFALSALIAVGCSSTTTRQDAPDDATGGIGAGGETGSNGDDLCTEYCETLEANCIDDFKQFVSRATCQEFCAQLPPGSEGDEIGNTVQCRVNQARIVAAVEEPELHCAEAGPGGNGTCGSTCEAYCVVLEQVCGARFNDEFLGSADCNSQCDTLDDDVRFNVSLDSGDSVQCRLWHLSAASVAPSTHCGHALALGEPPCADGVAN